MIRSQQYGKRIKMTSKLPVTVTQKGEGEVSTNYTMNVQERRNDFARQVKAKSKIAYTDD
jgi:hypothetical protein